MNNVRKSLLLIGAAGIVALATEPVRRGNFTFEREARAVFNGRSPKFLARRTHGLQMLSVRPAAGGGQDVFFQASTDVGDTFEESMRVNDIAGEVSDHGENSPVMLFSPDERDYAVWGSRATRKTRLPAISVFRDRGA